MYQKFIDLFMKKKSSECNERQALGNFAGVVGIVCNILLSLVKFVIGFITGSVSIKADAVNNFADSATAVLSIAAFKIASKPADKKHPFGHARIEYIVSMFLSFFLLLIGVDLFKTSLGKIVNPDATVYTLPVLIILFVSILLKVWLSFFYRYVARKINSNVLEATSAESLSDVLSTGAVLLSALITRFTEFNLDGYAGVLVSVFLLFNAFKILNDTKNHILGTAPDEKLIADIRDYALSNEHVLGIHDMCIHNYGPDCYFACFHAEVDGKTDVFITHDAVDNVERGIWEKFGVQCTIHLDPIVTDDEQVVFLRQQVSKFVKEMDTSLSIHDFRIVPGETHTNLIFDILVPYEFKRSDDEIVEFAEKKIKELSPNYFAVITVDKGELI